MPKMHRHLELTPLAALLHKAIDRSGKTQKQLAKEMGFTSVNMLSMLKHDTAPFPIERVIEAAIALDIDAGHLLHLVLEQWWPRRLPVIEEIFGIVASGNERKLILVVRQLTGHGDPDFSEAEIAEFVKRNRAALS